MRKLLLFVLLPLVTLQVNAQWSDYLNNLLNNLPDPVTNEEVLKPVRAYLPEGFSDFPSQGFIGISDPLVSDTLRAFQQAYLRAALVYALRQGTGRGITDFYTAEREGANTSVYEEFIRLSAAISLPVSQLRVSSYQLGSGEFIVILSPGAEKCTTVSAVTFKANVELYSKELTSDGITQNFSKILIKSEIRDSLSGITNKEVADYQFSNQNRIAVRTDFNGMTNNLDNYRFFYFHPLPTDSIDTQSEGALTFQGLWFATMADMFGQVTNIFQNTFTKVRRVGDNYNSTLTLLNRETGEFSYQLKLRKLNFWENKLYIELN